MQLNLKLPDHLVEKARKFGERRCMTLSQVVEYSLVLLLAETGPFRLQTITVRGEGLKEDMCWETIRAFIYEGRGE